MGAHQGMVLMPSIVGSGRGLMAKAQIKKDKINPKETEPASQGFISEVLSWAFIELPIACSVPATKIKG